ncbi:MAG: BON domain-containing protein, partial [Pseudomonadota bacterium]
PSCSPLGIATGLGASAGIAAVQEGGISRAASDARIQLEINELWFSYDVDTFTKLDMTVNQGRVLITGVVQNPEHRVEAVRLAWQPEGVQQVINEIRVADGEGLVGFAKDTWITTRLRTALTFDRSILSINYSIDTVQGTVYLMGFAQSREELNRVIEKARTINGVNGVVSYVKYVGQPNDVADGTGPDSSYVSTYDDNLVYRTPDGTSAPLQPYEDRTPIDLRAPQTRQDISGAYPNNVQPVQEAPVSQAPLDRPIILREDPLALPSRQAVQPSYEPSVQPNVQPNSAPRVRTDLEPTIQQPAQRQGIESEQIFWDGR